MEIIPDELENLGKCIIIGKSLKLNLDKNIDNISEIISIIKNIESREDKRPIPLFVKVTDEELKSTQVHLFYKQSPLLFQVLLLKHTKVYFFHL